MSGHTTIKVQIDPSGAPVVLFPNGEVAILARDGGMGFVLNALLVAVENGAR